MEIILNLTAGEIRFISAAVILVALIQLKATKGKDRK